MKLTHLIPLSIFFGFLFTIIIQKYHLNPIHQQQLTIKSDSITTLKHRLHAKKELMLTIEDSFPDNQYKACIRFKNIYNQTN